MRISARTLLLILLFFILYTPIVKAQKYNTLWIPDTLSGKRFELRMEEGHTHWIDTFETHSAGFNPTVEHDAFWGPTLFINKGDSVQMVVINNLSDTTTVHWHGMHLPAMMDGGPHQPIAPGARWEPHWKMDNNAATYWYHPHLHHHSLHQLTHGLGGLIIVRDEIESALPLPRTYGVDDIPLVLSDRRFDATTKELVDASYGDSMMVNGIMRAEFTVPAQVVRFRILNAATERSYNIGFSDNRPFYVITSDGGLLEKPVAVTRYLLSTAERIEILVDFGGKEGTTVNLRAFNSVLNQQTPGGDFFPNGPLANALARKDFDILHINVTTATAKPISAIPTALTANNYFTPTASTFTRVVTLSDSIIGPGGPTFLLNHRLFSMDYVDYKLPLGNTEIWEIRSTSGFGHPFHIHDVEFNIISRNGNAPAEYEKGWKDVVYVPARETVRFITRFEHFADSTHPFMFHCHIAAHEDAGLMGQFVVVDTLKATTGVEESTPNLIHDELHIAPNPADDELEITLPSQAQSSELRIMDMVGRIVYQAAPSSVTSLRLPLQGWAAGMYFCICGNLRQSFVVLR